MESFIVACAKELEYRSGKDVIKKIYIWKIFDPWFWLVSSTDKPSEQPISSLFHMYTLPLSHLPPKDTLVLWRLHKHQIPKGIEKYNCERLQRSYWKHKLLKVIERPKDKK